MNKIQRKIAAFNLSAVYGLAIWLFCCHGFDLHSQKKLQKAGVEKYHSVVSNGFNGDALQPLKSTNAVFNTAHPSGKNSFSEFATISRLTDRLISSSINQYSSLLIKVAVRYRKADIIFPFHYFW